MKKLLLITTILLAGATLRAENGEGDKDKGKKSHVSASTLSVQNSDYTTAVGIRAIGTSGLSIKHFTNSSRAIEGIIGFWPDAFSATILVENHAVAFEEPGLKWYYGAGGHVASKSDWQYHENHRRNRYEDGDLGLGIDGIIGIEYKIKEIPMAISMDLKPFVEVATNGHIFFALDPGLGIKVTF